MQQRQRLQEDAKAQGLPKAVEGPEALAVISAATAMIEAPDCAVTLNDPTLTQLYSTARTHQAKESVNLTALASCTAKDSWMAILYVCFARFHLNPFAACVEEMVSRT